MFPSLLITTYVEGPPNIWRRTASSLYHEKISSSVQCSCVGQSLSLKIMTKLP